MVMGKRHHSSQRAMDVWYIGCAETATQIILGVI